MKKVLSLFLACIMVLGLAACAQQADPEPSGEPTPAPLAEPTAQLEEPAGMTPGAYTASFRGYTSDVVTTVTVSETAIESVDVAHDETIGIGDYAVNSMPAEIVALQTAMVDAVAGATATSAAIRAGVMDCLKQAGADLSVFAAEAAKPTPEDITLNTDIVVIGAGAAGLTAALEALNEGASVIVVEKMDLPGGNTVRSSGAWNVAAHPEQVAAAQENPNLAKNRTTVEDFVQFTMEGGHNINNIDLVRTMVENSASVTDWMRDQGFEISFGDTKTSASVPGDARGLITGLKEKIEAKGGTLMLSTKADAIAMAEGKAVGITGTTGTGGKLTVNAKAVVVATGGFGYNLEMVYKLKPEFTGFVTNNQVGAMGDGILMAQAAGADVVDMEQIQAHPTVHQATANMLTEGCRGAGGILINTAGKRFTNECGFRDVVANAILEQDQQFAYILVNQEIVDTNANIAGYIKLGTLTGPFSTMDELVAFMGVDKAAFEETFNNWNQYVAGQNDPEFQSTFSWIRDLSTGPWYAAPVAPGIHHTMGGIRIDTKTQVISTAGEVIPGLFACGEVTGGVHGGNRVGGNAILDCLVFGRIAGMESTAYIK